MKSAVGNLDRYWQREKMGLKEADAGQERLHAALTLDRERSLVITMSERTRMRSAIYGRMRRAMLLVVFVLTLVQGSGLEANAAAKPKLNKSKLTMTVGQKKGLKIKHAGRKKVKWRSMRKPSEAD